MILIESADEFCSSSPQPNIVTLPERCSYDNLTTIDKGKCENNPCYGDDSSVEGECHSVNTHCCVPTSLSRVMIECEDYDMPIYLVSTCTCF